MHRKSRRIDGSSSLPLCEIALVLVRLDRVADCVGFAIPQATEWQRIGNQIDAAMIFSRADFVSVHEMHSGWLERLVRSHGAYSPRLLSVNTSFDTTNVALTSSFFICARRACSGINWLIGY